MSSEIVLTWTEALPHHLLIVRSWASYPISLSLSFIISKLGNMTTTSSKFAVKVKI